MVQTFWEDLPEGPYDDNYSPHPVQPGVPQPGAPPPQLGGTTDALGGGGDGDVPAFDYETPGYTGPMGPQYDFPNLPRFNAPEFQAPSGEDVFNDPGYQFRLSQGEQALQQSAAARGHLRTGGTLKDILGYGQNYASQEYANAYDRAMREYETQYQAARDEYAPRLLQYQGLFGAEQQRARDAWQRAWDQYTFGIDDEFRREEMLYP